MPNSMQIFFAPRFHAGLMLLLLNSFDQVYLRTILDDFEAYFKVGGKRARCTLLPP